MNKFSLRYDDVEPASSKVSKPLVTVAKPTKSSVISSAENVDPTVPPPPPLVNPQLFSTNPVPASAFLMAAAAAGKT